MTRTMVHKINHANIKDWAKNYDGELFDGVLCDPPYELGFMGKGWDSSGIAFDVEMWKSIYDLLKPGAHLLAFSGSRTYHRMAVAIEDAGFEIRDQLIWMYGSGFPKSLNIGKKIDQLQGNKREIIGKTQSIQFQEKGYKYDGDAKGSGFANEKYWGFGNNVTKGTSEWEGYGTALKPAHEPCVLARKPIDKGMTVAGNVLKHGTGGLNIDGTRVKTDEIITNHSRGAESAISKGKYGDSSAQETHQTQGQTLGRFPANLIHDGSDEVEAVFPQTGKSQVRKVKPTETLTKENTVFETSGYKTRLEGGINDGGGSASRFFYTAKASKSERNAGLERAVERAVERAGLAGEKAPTMHQNHHPTVKPLSLTKYLATLIKPPTGGRLLVPFSGSGSEMIGALQAGWGYVEGVELTEEYIPIAEARIKYWMSQKEEDTKQLELI